MSETGLLCTETLHCSRAKLRHHGIFLQELSVNPIVMLYGRLDMPHAIPRRIDDNLLTNASPWGHENLQLLYINKED